MAGRVPSAGEFRNFGGLNQSSTRLNLGTPYAEDIDNFDINGTGAIETRLDLLSLATFDSNVQYATSWVDIDGTVYYCVVAANKIWVATDPQGTWTDYTGSVTITENVKPWSSCAWRGVLYLVNGTDYPIYLEPGQDAITLKDASLLDPPTVTVEKIGTLTAITTTFYWLVVEACTGRGSTGCVVTPTQIPYDWTGVDTTNYLAVSWPEVTSASTIRIWMSNGRNGTPGLSNSYYRLLAELPGNATEFAIQSTTGITNAYTFDVNNTAYNTPANWETNGQPYLIGVLSRGRDERMVCVRGNLVWFSGLADSLDWFTPGNAFGLTINGGTNNYITSMTNLYDFYAFFSATDGFLYHGASQDTMDQDKIVPVGCKSPLSIVYADGDAWLWVTQAGPAPLQRIVAGADVEIAKQFTAPVKDVVNDVNTDKLDQITGVYVAASRRLIWYYPKTGSSVNNAALVYQLDTKSFTKYDSVDVKVAFINQAFTPFGLSATGDLGQIGAGPVAYTCSYLSPWFTTGGFQNKKRVQYIDVVMDSTTDYDVTVTYSFEFGNGYQESVHIIKSGSTVTTNGMNVDRSRIGSKVNVHRIYTHGTGVAWQLQFATSSYAKILGWKPEYLVLGGTN
jgi:hypothetical protein